MTLLKQLFLSIVLVSTGWSCSGTSPQFTYNAPESGITGAPISFVVTPANASACSQPSAGTLQLLYDDRTAVPPLGESIPFSPADCSPKTVPVTFYGIGKWHPVLSGAAGVSPIPTQISISLGSGFPSPYDCEAKGGVQNTHCYAIAHLDPGIYKYASVNIKTPTLSPGNGAATDEIWVQETQNNGTCPAASTGSGLCWFEAGYAADAGEKAAPLYYFDGDQSQETGNLPEEVFLGAVPGGVTSTTITLSYTPPGPNIPPIESAIYAKFLPDGAPGFGFPSFYETRITPNDLMIGLEVSGTQGASATLSTFSNITYEAVNSGGPPSLLPNNVTFSTESDNPPAGGWQNPPGVAPTHGVFVTQCC